MCRLLGMRNLQECSIKFFGTWSEAIHFYLFQCFILYSIATCIVCFARTMRMRKRTQRKGRNQINNSVLMSILLVHFASFMQIKNVNKKCHYSNEELKIKTKSPTNTQRVIPNIWWSELINIWHRQVLKAHI